MTDRRTQILQAATRRIARDGVRGMRVTDVAEEAGVSPGLLYYHFTDRAGLLESAMEHINDHAREARSTDQPPESAFGELEQQLLGELDDDHEVRGNSAAWNELRALAVFEENLREPLARTTATWVEEIARVVSAVQAERGAPTSDTDPSRTAIILTALVEGLSNRWLAEGLSTEQARSLLSEAAGRLVHVSSDHTGCSHTSAQP